MIVGIVTDPMVGGTFLSWTLHFLSGHTEYYSVKSKKWYPLISNPLSGDNAHAFNVNQPNVFDEVISYIDRLMSEKTDTFHTLYYHNLPYLNTPKEKMQSAIDKTFASSHKRIVLVNDQHNALYFCKYGARTLSHKFKNLSQRYNTYDEQHADFIDVFFKESKDSWEDVMKHKWDEREFLSLNLRPFSNTTVSNYIDTSTPHYWLHTSELWNSFDVTVRDMFKYLETDVDDSRWDSWLSIYSEWRKLHHDRLQFARYFDKIVQNIIDNGDMDLTRFNLDIIREAAIQHALIYRHGLTLKGWGVEKFPDNTKELHTLLEPNIYHDVDDIYNMLKGNK